MNANELADFQRRLDDTLAAGAPPELLPRAAAVRLFLFDVDGTLTDGRLFLGDHGAEFKCFDARDGQGVVMLMAAGIEVGIITGRRSPVVAERMSALGIRHIHQGQSDKCAALAQIRATTGLKDAEIAYMGDDLPDAPVLAHVGLALTPADAHPQVRRLAHWVVPHAGGAGAARAACELVLAAQGLLAAAHARFGLAQG
jgi:3-deoxy-D-manno-octulosonate 8-phosphate phosphatase (KDO 8-P phosphatase)